MLFDGKPVNFEIVPGTIIDGSKYTVLSHGGRSKAQVAKDAASIEKFKAIA